MVEQDPAVCPDCSLRLRWVDKVGWVHVVNGAYRLCPNRVPVETA